ncbi:MAG: CPBP family intramembrane metalloprotease [Lachnospiraceae bacterium]|nr:CPBP family intramembrane metalloprotease [Lachnospiraceae bacterium]
MEKKQKKQNVLTAVLAIYFICYGFRVFEYFILRTDKTWVGEAVVHKLTGIVILFAAVGFLRETLADIGLARKGRLRNIGKGLFFGIGVFIIAYAVEIMMAIAGGTFVSLQVYVSTYAVDQNLGHRTEWLFFIICIVGNMVNVFMEEGIFRGLFQKILEKKYSFMCSALIASILFGLWHIVGPIRNYFDGVSGVEGMIANAIMLTVTSALVGFKFALLTKMTGSLYMAMGDHFVNNTIVNILHVVSETGIDEMMFVRITIAQSVSFLLVLICYIRREHKRR